MIELDATNYSYRRLNEEIRELVAAGEKEIHLHNVLGQRYLGTGLTDPELRLEIDGVPGEDLAAFLGNGRIVANQNAQDGVGNTMNDGKVIVRGMAGDVVGYGMRGGRVYIGGNVGYRVGIHMKGYRDKQPIIVVGGKAGAFFGEYMAGGYLILLGMGAGDGPVVGDYCATGMHGGVMFVRGQLPDRYLNPQVDATPLTEVDCAALEPILHDFQAELGVDENLVDFSRYRKVTPRSERPYGSLYAY